MNLPERKGALRMMANALLNIGIIVLVLVVLLVIEGRMPVGKRQV
jgi:hypothetical protein